ncbi:MAG: hypothetical protein GX957_02070 [Clostridiaceae bacterium]|nr:hypothetical protein [Clostridiaceae bacterium]
MLRLTNLKLKITEAKDEKSENLALRDMIIARLKIKEQDLKGFKIFKRSVDARKKDNIYFVYAVDVKVSAEKEILKKQYKGVETAPDLSYKWPETGINKLTKRPVIIGMGPAGLFAGLFLSKKGYRPIILERGDDVDTRINKINDFWTNGKLDTESNVQFGEGGAGTFSDGKLNTLINDIRCHTVLKEFVNAGAPSDILYKNKPHIGTDCLRNAVKNLRKEILANGGDVRFNAKVTDFVIKNEKIVSIMVNDIEEIPCEVVLLAIGHSARDTFERLHDRGVYLSPKSFSIGVRIEHPQKIIDCAQYGKYAGFPRLGPADYKLSYHSKSGRSAYSFCMCPGGYVVAAASEKECVVTNGMSEYSRDGENANSALLVGVTPEDFGSHHPLAGIDFQRKYEHLAFQYAGGNYKAPVQLTGDFLSDRNSTDWGNVKPTYKPGTVFVELKDILPGYVVETLKEALIYFNNKIKGFAMPDSILTGVETRSSSPVRINRNEEFMSNIEGLYPMGEGAGYAGGIMSSAVDGIKIAEKVMQKYAPL